MKPRSLRGFFLEEAISRRERPSDPLRGLDAHPLDAKRDWVERKTTGLDDRIVGRELSVGLRETLMPEWLLNTYFKAAFSETLRRLWSMFLILIPLA